MSHPRRALFAVAAYLIILGAASLIPAERAHTQGSSRPDPVTVTNTPLPVSLQGTGSISGSVSVTNTPNVNVANTPNVNVAGLPAVQLAGGTTVGITGTPSVNVANSPSVTVANSPTVTVGNDVGAPVPVRDAAIPNRQPFQFTFHSTGLLGDSYTVPAGKRLVVRHLNGLTQASQDTTFIEVGIQDATSFDPAVTVVMEREGVSGILFRYVLNAEVEATYGAGHTVISEALSPSGGIDGFRLLISGYLEDAP
jgi:hypothetical protein